MRFRRAVLALLLVWVLTSIWFGSDSGISVPGLFVIVGGAGLLLLVWLLWFVVALKRKERMKAAWVEPTVLVLVLLAIYFGALFHLRFLASRRSLDRYVARTLAAHESHRTPTNVGLFVARETEILPNGAVRIITSSRMFDECGLAFSRTPPPVVGEDRYDHLVGNWWRWSRSW